MSEANGGQPRTDLAVHCRGVGKSYGLGEELSLQHTLSTLVRLTASSVPFPDRDNYYTFTLAVTGSEEAMNRIASAAYEFNHPTFQQKVQRSSDRSSGFSVSYIGWGCLRSVIVTLQPMDKAEKPERIDFNMCDALTQSAQPKVDPQSKGVEGVVVEDVAQAFKPAPVPKKQP